MRLNRFLKQENIDLSFDPLSHPLEGSAWEPGSDEGQAETSGEESEEELTKHQLRALKERVIGDLVGLLEQGGRVANPRKLFLDLRNREAKATTGLGKGVAMPHVRTVQAKGFTMAVAVAPEPGIPFDAVDGEPVRLFFAMVAPPHDDRYYLKVERALAAALADSDELRDGLLEARNPGEVIRLLARWID